MNWWSWDAKELGHTGSSGGDGLSANSIARASVGDTRARNRSAGVVPGDRVGDRRNLPVLGSRYKPEFSVTRNDECPCRGSSVGTVSTDRQPALSGGRDRICARNWDQLAKGRSLRGNGRLTSRKSRHSGHRSAEPATPRDHLSGLALWGHSPPINPADHPQGPFQVRARVCGRARPRRRGGVFRGRRRHP